MSWKNVSIGQACHWVVCVTVALPKRKKQGEQWWDFVNNRFTCINYVSIQQVKTLYISLNSKRLIRSFSILSTKKYVVLNLTFDSNTQISLWVFLILTTGMYAEHFWMGLCHLDSETLTLTVRPMLTLYFAVLYLFCSLLEIIPFLWTNRTLSNLAVIVSTILISKVK